jgi:hypothetical protein
MYPDSTHVASPVYISCKSEEPRPHFHFTLFLHLSSPIGLSPELQYPHPEVVERPLQVYGNPLFISQSSSPQLQMSMVGGGGAEGGTRGGTRGGGGQGIPLPPPRIFSKVVARYSPLVLPPILHDLLYNYMKSLLKFMGKGDLTAIEHINFFYQFMYILSIEHEDVYLRLL